MPPPPELVQNFTALMTDNAVAHPAAGWSWPGIGVASPTIFYWPSAGSMPYIGVCLNILGTSIACVGWLVQKYSHLENEKEAALNHGDEQVRNPRVRWPFPCPEYAEHIFWAFGLGVFIIGQLLCAASFAFAPQSIVSTLNCWTIIITYAVAPFALGEQVRFWRVLSVLVIVAGCGIVLDSGPMEYTEFTMERMYRSVSDPRCLVIIVLCGLIAIISYLALKRIAAEIGQSNLPAVQVCLYAAMVSWVSVLCTKTFMSLLFNALGNHRSFFAHWEVYVLFVIMLASAGLNIHLMNLALKSGQATYVVPCYDSAAMTGQILFGGLFFDEFHAMSREQLASFFFGVMIVVSGIFMISVDGPDHPIFQMRILGPESALPDSQAATASAGGMGGIKVPMKYRERERDLRVPPTPADFVQPKNSKTGLVRDVLFAEHAHDLGSGAQNDCRHAASSGDKQLSSEDQALSNAGKFPIACRRPKTSAVEKPPEVGKKPGSKLQPQRVSFSDGSVSTTESDTSNCRGPFASHK